MPRIAIVVGEASGDLLARGLINALRERCPEAEFVGITGPKMRAAGCKSWGDCEQLAVMGLVEVLRHLPRLRRLMKSLRARLRDDPPDVLIGIDAPDFNIRLEAYARKIGIPTVHYVCPSVWAWRQGRVKTIRRSCDLVLCLLPFEKSFLEKHAVSAEFVGHPLADEIGDGLNREECRQRLGLGTGPCLAVLPGSRQGEVELLGPVFLETVLLVRRQYPELQCAVAAANSAIATRMQELAAAAGILDSVTVHVDATRDVLGAADTVLLTSGTATLETMLMRRPMVVAYKANPVTAWIGKRLVRIKYFALPNLLADERLVPEFLQEEVSPQVLAESICRQLSDSDGIAELEEHFIRIADSLRCSASERAADAVLRLPAMQKIVPGHTAVSEQ